MALLAWVASAWAADPTVSNVRSAQRPGTQLVDIDYDLTDPDSATLTVSVAVSDNGGATYTVPAVIFSGAVGAGVTPGIGKRITWNAGPDWPNKFSANVRFRVTASDGTLPPAPDGMALIPAGTFQMGDTFGEGRSDEIPVHSVFVSGFYMDRTEVTARFWDDVWHWGRSHGYSDLAIGWGNGVRPLETVRWYDVVKWCNARSEREGRTPAYYTSAAQTTVYRAGRVDLRNDWVKWGAGYRLPTEAEWEKAARGGAGGQRFPWGDTITHSQANYYSTSNYAYDVSSTRGWHPIYAVWVTPWSSPVGSFAANGYGLYDMAGNVWEWCWDWYGSYSSGSQTDPRGPDSGSARVIRGGSWISDGFNCRTANRSRYTPGGDHGFRSVLPLGQP